MPTETENNPSKTSIATTITAIATLLTAIGGLIYAVKSTNSSGNDEKKISKTLINNIEHKTAKIYHGNVGKLETTFNLSFDKNSNSVNGNYYYNKKQDQLYQISGVFTDDEIKIDEFTQGNISANCVLKIDGEDCLHGKMYNNDGRIHEMNICE